MIKIKNVTKRFRTGEGTVEALKNVSLTVENGEIFGIIGMSGAGKSTLVRCINMLERPTEGSIEIDGADLCTLSESELRKIRQSVTMIFQGFNLLMQRTCLGNVCFPLEISGVPKKEAVKRAGELLEIVGLSDKARAYPSQLSGGQQQRVAIARALATNPKILLCDEATSALDPTTTKSVLELIREINSRLKITVIVITHQMSVVESICDRVAILDGGEIVEVGEVASVFAHPKSNAAKRLVYPEEYSSDIISFGTELNLVRVVFNGASAAASPLIAEMALEKGVKASIVYASTKSIADKAYGLMLLGISDGAEAVKTAVEYLNCIPDISAEEVERNA